MAHAAPDSVVTVGASTGKLSVRRKGNGTVSRLMSGQSLYIGDVVFTGPESKASLLFPDGAQVRLNANASIEVTPPRRVRNGNIRLFKVIAGQVWARLRPGNAIETRTAVLGVRGTEIMLDVADDGSTTLTVTDGSVDFYNDLGAVLVGQSQQSVARFGAAPTAPITIQNAGFIVEWTLNLDRAVIPRETFFVSLDRSVAAREAQSRRELVRSEPQDASAHRDYADALFDMGNYEEAVQQYETALALRPGDAELTTRAGYALLEAGHVEAAERSFLLALNGNSPLSTPKIVSIDFDLSPESGSEPVSLDSVPLEVALQRPTAAPALVGLASLALAHDRPEEAQKVAQIALRANGDFADARVALGIALLRQPGRLEEAKSALQGALQDEPSTYHYQAHSWLSLAYLAQDDRESALREAKLAVKMAPKSGLAHGNLALVYFYAGQGQLAEKEGQLALKLNPESVAARVALGQAALSQGDVDGANYVAAQAVALDPDLPQARYLLGVSDASRRDYKHAIRELNHAITLAPDFLAASSALARVYTAVGRNDDATELLTGMIPRYRQTDAVYGALGGVYYEQGRYAQSAASYRNALEKNPRSALYQAELARTLIYSNQLPDALEAGRTAVAMAPEVGQYHAILGLAYEFSSLPSQAEREFRSALTLDPQNALALTQLAYRHTGADLRPAAAGFAQGFLLDPSISRQLLRGGTNVESTPTVGSRSELGLSVSHRETIGDGKFQAFGQVGRTATSGIRSNDDNKGLDVSEYLTYQASPRTNIYANLRGQRADQGLRGADSAPDFDSNSNFRYGQAQLAARQRVSSNLHLWAGLFANSSRNTTVDPGAGNFSIINNGFHVSRQTYTSGAIEPELRLDMDLNRQPGHVGTLTMGVAKTNTNFRGNQQLQLAPFSDGVSRTKENVGGLLAYTQLSQQLSSKFSLIGQLRLQHQSRSNDQSITFSNGAPLFASSDQSRTQLLPSLLATYQPSKRTTLRFSYNQRLTDTTASTFAPTETLLETERSALPYGIPQNLHLTQLDAERTISSRGFLKLFLFHSTADSVQIGFSDQLGFGGGLPAAQAPGLQLARWKGSGAGMRYEHQLSRNLYANMGAVMRQTRSFSGDSIATNFDNQTAPYEPNFLGNLDLNYLDSKGRRIGLGLRHNGAFFQDSPLSLGRTKFGPQTYVDLSLAKEFSVHSEVFFNVSNLFNSSQIQFKDYSIGQRQLSFGVRRRF